MNLLDYVSGLKVYLYTIRQIGFYKKCWSNFATVELTIDFPFKQKTLHSTYGRLSTTFQKQLITFNAVLITLDFAKLAGGASGVRAVAKLISYFA